MGLDMFLKKKFYIGAQYEHNKVKGIIEITRDGKPVQINFNKVENIEEEAGYWRKANHIHKWFVDNCQDGVDDCREAYVNEEDLNQLLDCCKMVKSDHSLADSLLPGQGGFFFGSTEPDEWYFKNIDDTIEIIEAILKDKEGREYLPYDVYYRSSW